MTSHRRPTSMSRAGARLAARARVLRATATPTRKRVAAAALSLAVVASGVVVLTTLSADTPADPRSVLGSLSEPSEASPSNDARNGATDPPRSSPKPDPGVGDEGESSARVKPNLLARLAQELAESQEPEAAVFRAATLNVLGARHTRNRGKKASYRSGPSRMVGAVAALRSQGIDIVALQEFEDEQKSAFGRLTGSGWSVFTGPGLGRNAIAWRTDVWDVVHTGTRLFPYFKGKMIPLPFVLLSHRATGRPLYVISMHNPANGKGRGNQQRWRDLATTIQVRLVKELAREGTPVLLMGDFNERADAFCRVAGAGLIAANGGSVAPCRPPAKVGIDWIFGTRNLRFADYARIDELRRRGITDHPLVVATVTFDGEFEVSPAPPDSYDQDD